IESTVLGYLCDAQRQLGAATWVEAAEEAVAISEAFRSRRSWGHLQLTLACAAIEVDDLDRADLLLERGLRELRAVGFQYAESLGIEIMGHSAFARGRVLDAIGLYRRSAEGYARMEAARWHRPRAFQGAAEAMFGDIEGARASLAEAAGHGADRGFPALLHV